MPASLAEVPAALAALVADWGFDGGFYVSGPARIEPASRSVQWQAKPAMVAALPAALGRTYLADFLGRDPLLVRVVLADSAIYWDRDAVSADLMKESGPLLDAFAAVGLTRGLSIPIYRNRRLGYFNYLSRLPADRFAELLGRSLRTLTMVAIGLHQTVQNLLDEAARRGERDAVQPLSEREAEMLLWSARGKTVGETGVILGISEKTVQFHLSNCLRKLDVANKVEAATRAIRLGFIQP